MGTAGKLKRLKQNNHLGGFLCSAVADGWHPSGRNNARIPGGLWHERLGNKILLVAEGRDGRNSFVWCKGGDRSYRRSCRGGTEDRTNILLKNIVAVRSLVPCGFWKPAFPQIAARNKYPSSYKGVHFFLPPGLAITALCFFFSPSCSMQRGLRL